MQLFKRLLGLHTDHRVVAAEGTDTLAPAGTRTVLDIFHTDLHRIELAGFTEGKAEILMNGDIVQNYVKVLDYKEYDIFDTVAIKITGGKSVSAVFRSTSPAAIGPGKMKKIIDDLYCVYGNDNSNKGQYNDGDANEYTDSQFYTLFGRDWMDYPRYEYPVSLRRYPGEVYISIWGLNDRNIIR